MEKIKTLVCYVNFFVCDRHATNLCKIITLCPILLNIKNVNDCCNFFFTLNFKEVFFFHWTILF